MLVCLLEVTLARGLLLILSSFLQSSRQPMIFLPPPFHCSHDSPKPLCSVSSPCSASPIHFVYCGLNGTSPQGLGPWNTWFPVGDTGEVRSGDSTSKSLSLLHACALKKAISASRPCHHACYALHAFMPSRCDRRLSFWKYKLQ